MDKKVIYSAVQPTHCLTLGNYIGALNNWLQYQQEESNDCIFAIADLHALTVRQEPGAYRERCLSLFAQYLAMVWIAIRAYYTSSPKCTSTRNCSGYSIAIPMSAR